VNRSFLDQMEDPRNCHSQIQCSQVHGGVRQWRSICIRCLRWYERDQRCLVQFTIARVSITNWASAGTCSTDSCFSGKMISRFVDRFDSRIDLRSNRWSCWGSLRSVYNLDRVSTSLLTSRLENPEIDLGKVNWSSRCRLSRVTNSVDWLSEPPTRSTRHCRM
jgi:hypothetical protein